MRESIKPGLKDLADEVAKRYSNVDRAKNDNQEQFVVEAVRPTSENTAVVTFWKSSGKRALAWFYYVNGVGKWYYFFPNDSHILGMSMFGILKQKIEEANL